MPFNSVNDYADYRNEGAWWQSTYLRTTAPAVGVTNRWLDLSVGSGHPVYNAYGGTPATATPLINNTNLAVYTGPQPTANQTKHLHTISVDTSSTVAFPATFLLCDYLMHYPFVDLSDTAEQTMDNTSTLPRSTTGEGVMCFVVVQAPTTGAGINGTCTINYTNSAGVSGRSTTVALIGSAVIGALLNAGDNNTSVITTQCSPFIPLAVGDKGIRSIQSITMGSGIGGLAAFVLCDPVASIPLLTNITQTEKTFFSRTGRAPRIQNGAYLHFLMCNGGTNGPSPAVFRSSLTFVWG